MTILRSRNPGELGLSVEAEPWLSPRLPCGDTCLILSRMSSWGCIQFAVTCLCLGCSGGEMLAGGWLPCATLGQASCLGLEAQPRGLAEVRSVRLQPPFQGWKEGVKELPY